MFNWSPGMSLEYLERTAIQQALKFYQGNKTLTARSLGCAINTINSKLEKYAEDDRNAKLHAEREQRKTDDFNRRQRGERTPGTGLPSGTGSDAPEGKPKDAAAPGNGATPGQHVEPAIAVAPQSPVPMPQRKEVQAVLPKQAASGGNNKKR